MVYRYQIPSTEKKVRLVYSTGEKVQPRYWKKKAYKAIVPKNHKEYSKMNDRLSDLAKLAKAIYEDYDYGEISVSDFKDELDYRSERKKRPVPEVEETHKPFMRFIDDYIEERINKENSKRGTWKMFRTTANHLKKYAKDKGKVLDYEDFDYNFLNDFENWLYKAPRRHSTNYASKVLSVVRQFLHAATRAGYNQNMTFSQRGYSIDKIKIRKEVLSFDELRTLYDLDLSKNPRLNRVRDLFLIGAYSGLRFSDFTRIRPDHIIVEDGIEMIHIFTQKTDTEVYIPLLPELRSILRRNGNSSPKTISNQKMNVYLKELFEYAGFDEDGSEDSGDDLFEGFDDFDNYQ